MVFLEPARLNDGWHETSFVRNVNTVKRPG